MNSIQNHQQNLPSTLDESAKLEIANRFLLGEKPQYIADNMGLRIEEVQWILAQEKVQEYINKSASNTEIQLNLKRIKRAEELQDGVLDAIENMLNNPDFPIEMWKDSHVSLIKDVLLKQLPTTINKTIGMAIQFNFGTAQPQQNIDDTSLRNILSKLEPGAIIMFREMIEDIGEIFKGNRLEKIKRIQDVINEIE